eukprot:358651-Chlamydomonas_euryale.AAC.1
MASPAQPIRPASIQFSSNFAPVPNGLARNHVPVCRSVAMLRSHRDIRVAQAAVTLAHQWRTTLAAAAGVAEAALEEGGAKRRASARGACG